MGYWIIHFTGFNIESKNEIKFELMNSSAVNDRNAWPASVTVIARLAYKSNSNFFMNAGGRLFFLFSAAKASDRASSWGQLPEPEMRSE